MQHSDHHHLDDYMRHADNAGKVTRLQPRDYEQVEPQSPEAPLWLKFLVWLVVLTGFSLVVVLAARAIAWALLW